jgi:hypothetical protein
MWRSLWADDGSVVYNYCWSSPAQSISGPSPVGLTTIFYCLWFDTSLFVASYDSQGYGGGIWPCLHKVKLTFRLTVGQSVSWCPASSGAHDQIFINVWQLRSCFCEAPSLKRGRVSLLYMLLVLASTVFSGPTPLELATIFYCLSFETYFSSPPTIRRLTVEVFDPASTRVRLHTGSGSLLYCSGTDRRENFASKISSWVARKRYWALALVLLRAYKAVA